MSLWITGGIAGLSALGGILGSGKTGKAQKRAQAMFQPAVDAAQLSQIFGAASADPTNPYNENLTLLLQDAMRQDTLRGMREALSLDARQTRRSGRASVFVNPERRDEARSRSILDAFLNIGGKARGEASSRLLSASGANATAANSLTNAIKPQADIQLQRGQNQGDLMSGLTKIFQNFMGGGGGSDALGKLLGGGGSGGSGAGAVGMLPFSNLGQRF